MGLRDVKDVLCHSCCASACPLPILLTADANFSAHLGASLIEPDFF